MGGNLAILTKSRHFGTPPKFLRKRSSRLGVVSLGTSGCALLNMPIKLTPLLVWRIVLLLVGLALIAFSLPLLLVVGVNLPDSRYGLFYVAITLTAGGACIAYSAKSRFFFRPAVLLLGLLLVLTGVASFPYISSDPNLVAVLAFEIVWIGTGIGCIAAFFRSANREDRPLGSRSRADVRK